MVPCSGRKILLVFNVNAVAFGNSSFLLAVSETIFSLTRSSNDYFYY